MAKGLLKRGHSLLIVKSTYSGYSVLTLLPSGDLRTSNPQFPVFLAAAKCHIDCLECTIFPSPLSVHYLVLFAPCLPL